MTNSEKIALLTLILSIKPTISIEIGTKEGGSLQLISHFSEKVYSLDIDPGVGKLAANFNNVIFIIGDSAETLPALLAQLALKGEYPDFIFIDGDHSAEGVFRDITNSLQTTITKPLHILMHDSFNPDCRSGMLKVDYASYKNVQMVDLDFIHGVYSPSALTRA
jgi:cephalosporin hydroxylase